MEKINVNEPNKIAKKVIATAQQMGLKIEMITHGTFYLSNQKKKMMFAGCMPETTSAISYRLSTDKFFTNQILKKHGFPVLDMERYKNFQQAQEFLKRNKKIVIKPRNGIHGKGITVGITKNGQIKKAVLLAEYSDEIKKVILEKYVTGKDYRILVVGYKKIFVINRVPAFVKGDGQNTIRQLWQQFNQSNNGKYHYPVPDDNITETIIKEQGYRWDNVPNKNELVFLRKTANIKSGGLAIEVTDKINPKVKKQAIAISELFKLDIAGIDWISKDIASEKGYFIEVNAYPGILLHYYPTEGKSYDVARELLNYFFFPDKF